MSKAEFLGTSAEVPAELFLILNLKAAQAWEKILACAGGNGDRARELYRTAGFDCEHATFIRSRLADIRSSLPKLAASLEVALFFDQSRMAVMESEMRERIAQLSTEVSSMQPSQADEQSLRELERLRHRRSEVEQWRRINNDFRLTTLLNLYRPKMPRLHPLLAQVILEELLSLIEPDERPNLIADRFKRNPSQQIYLYQLLLWANAIEDRGCAPMGLWPSANRAAADSFGQSILESMNAAAGPLRTTPHTLIAVDCPHLPPGWAPQSAGLATVVDPKSFVQLSQPYLEGRLSIWRELLEVRHRYQ